MLGLLVYNAQIKVFKFYSFFVFMVLFCNNVLACMEALVQTQPVQQLQHRLWHLEPKSRAHKQGARTQHRAKCVGRRGQGKRKTEGEKGSM